MDGIFDVRSGHAVWSRNGSALLDDHFSVAAVCRCLLSPVGFATMDADSRETHAAELYLRGSAGAGVYWLF